MFTKCKHCDIITVRRGERMIKSIRIRLRPTKKQEEIMWHSVNAKNFAYNWGLSRADELYKEGEKWNKTKIRKEFNEYKKDFDWIKKVSSQVTGNAFEDLDVAMKRFFKKQSNFPRFKTKKNSKKSFYVRYDYIFFNSREVQMEKIGKVAYSTNYSIPNLPKYIRPACSFDGKYWYLSFGYEQTEPLIEHTEEIIGIDLGIQTLAVCSNGMIFPNINKSIEVKRLDKKIRRLQRQVSRKYKMNTQDDEYIKTKNIVKMEKDIQLIYRRLVNIRQNHIHQATSQIINQKPSKIIMEDLDVQDMLRKEPFAKGIAEQKWDEFRRQIEYKCKFHGIEFIKADRYFPSSKMCSSCGSVKEKLSLSDRFYECEKCELVMDRDENAAKNLSQYKVIETT